MKKHDPLTDPQPGDVVASEHAELTVVAVGLDVSFRKRIADGLGPVQPVTLDVWRAWCRFVEAKPVTEETR